MENSDGGAKERFLRQLLVPRPDFHLVPRPDFHPGSSHRLSSELGICRVSCGCPAPATGTIDRMVGSTTAEALV